MILWGLSQTITLQLTVNEKEYLMIKQTLALIGLTLSVSVNAATIFIVDGATQWQATGVIVSAGQTLNIQATGLVIYIEDSSFPPLSPDGFGAFGPSDPSNLLPSAPFGTLIGKIGSTPVPEALPGFGAGFVGSSYSQTMPISGELYLAFNDNVYSDNGGSFTATISTVPIPAAAWLFGSALLGLGVIKRKGA